MGHYDDCYEFEREQRAERQEKELRRSVDKLVTAATPKDLQLVKRILSSPDRYHNLFSFLNGV